MFATLYSIIQVYSCCASFYYIGCFFIIRQSNTGPWLHSNQNCSSWTRPTRPSLCHATLRSYRCVTERPISTHTVLHTVCLPSAVDPEKRKVTSFNFLLQVSTIHILVSLYAILQIQFYKRFSNFARERESETNCKTLETWHSCDWISGTDAGTVTRKAKD